MIDIDAQYYLPEGVKVLKNTKVYFNLIPLLFDLEACSSLYLSYISVVELSTVALRKDVHSCLLHQTIDLWVAAD